MNKHSTWTFHVVRFLTMGSVPLLMIVGCGAAADSPDESVVNSTEQATLVPNANVGPGGDPIHGFSAGTCTAAEQKATTVIDKNFAVHFWTCTAAHTARFICDDVGNKVVEDCACTSQPVGVDDYCHGGTTHDGAGDAKCTALEFTTQDDAPFDNASIWQCQGETTRYVCDGWGNKVVESCPLGCSPGDLPGADGLCLPFLNHP